MTDLDTLRPEVREVLDKIRKCVLRCEPSLDPGLATVRAELLRLEGVEKVRDEVCAIWARDKASAVHYLDRAKKAEAELADLKAKYAELDELSKNTVQCLREQDDEADRNATELAALKARIADAPEWYDHPDCVGISASGVMIGLHGKRVRLLVEDNVTSNQ